MDSLFRKQKVKIKVQSCALIGFSVCVLSNQGHRPTAVSWLPMLLLLAHIGVRFWLFQVVFSQMIYRDYFEDYLGRSFWT